MTNRLRRLVRFSIPTLATALIACSDSQPSVLLVTIDTLRPDYMGMNGYDRPTTPFLDALVARGFYFEQAVSPIARTTPALGSLLTGAYPHRTGIRKLTDVLDPEITTLAELLAARGYQTLAVVANQLVGPERGLARGFGSYDHGGHSQVASLTTDTALRRVATLSTDEPFFLWVHYIDPHVPYHTDREIARALDPDYRGPYLDRFGRNGGPDEHPSAQLAFPVKLPKGTATHRNPLPSYVNEHIRRLYAADIRRSTSRRSVSSRGSASAWGASSL